MADTSSNGLAEKGQDEKLGAYIRRARLAAQMDLTDLARKIRIAPDVLLQIEESKWDAFPVEAYVRGYLNSLCIHLELDRSKVLGWFGSEYHSTYVMPVAALRDVGVVQPTVATSSNNKLIPALIVILIVVFFVVMNILRSNDTPPAENPLPPSDSLVAKTASTDSFATDTLGTDSLVDSNLLPGDPALAPQTIGSDSTKVSKIDAAKQAEEAKRAEAAAKATADSLKVVAAKSKTANTETNIKLECIRDSVWVRVKRSGEKAKTYQIKEGSPRYFSHTDTIEVRIAGPERTRLYIDERRVRFQDNKDLTIVNGKLVKAEP